MKIHQKYGLTTIINATGTFTPLGVSRSSSAVGRTVAEALSEFFVMDELQDVAGREIAEWTGAEAGTVTHCVSAAIVLSVAAAITGNSADAVAVMPETKGMPNRVVLPAGHAINYGHPILQDIRLAGAIPVLAGSKEQCSLDDLENQLDQPDVVCLLLVSSRLVSGQAIDLGRAVAAAQARGLPAFIDGAAQDMRIKDLLKTNADLILVSAQKYLASPTAGLVIGRKEMVTAVRAHEKGIGRAMKASKEAICGVLAAIAERKAMDLAAWRDDQKQKLDRFIQQVNSLPGIHAVPQADPVGMPFARAQLTVDPDKAGMSAEQLSASLRSGTPSIWVMNHALAEGQIVLELVPLDNSELDIIFSRVSTVLGE
jgi:uncharacterized pyridoxal phosphate-dependent enzyme